MEPLNLELISHAMVRIARPFDRILPGFHHIDYSKQHHQLLKKAYKYLDDEVFYNKWESEYQQSLIDDDYTSCEFIELTEYVGPARLKLLNDKSNLKPLRQHCDFATLAEALNINKNHVLTLIEAKAIPQLNTTNVIADKLFDLSKIKAHFNSRFVSKISSAEEIKANDGIFENYLSNYGELLVGVSKGEITASAVSANSLASVFVNTFEFEKWLRQALIKACEKPVKIERVEGLLDKTSSELKALIHNSDMFIAKWRNSESIDGSSLKSYLKLVKPNLFE